MKMITAIKMIVIMIYKIMIKIITIIMLIN